MLQLINISLSPECQTHHNVQYRASSNVNVNCTTKCHTGNTISLQRRCQDLRTGRACSRAQSSMVGRQTIWVNYRNITPHKELKGGGVKISSVH